jgi:adenylate cyclase
VNDHPRPPSSEPGLEFSAKHERQAVAERAGVAPEYLDRLVELGILEPDDGDRFSDGDIRRVGMVASLERSGLAPAGLAEAIRRGELSLAFVDQPVYERFASYSGPTFGELSASTGIPTDVLFVVREAMGSAQPAADDRLRPDELQVVPLVELLVRQGISRAAIERTLRVGGESLRRMAETEAGWWLTEVMQPLFQAGKSGAEVGELTGGFAAELSPVADQAVLAAYHGQQATAWMRNIFEGFEQAMTRAGLHTRSERPPAICFLDITGYTRLTDEHGDRAAADLAGELARLVQRASVRHGGKPVKWLGDGVMFYFPDPGPGVEAALEMVAGTVPAGLPPAHVGIHAGPVLFQEGDYFGRTVNAAARIADYARPGEVLVSQEVVEASAVSGVVFSEIGPVELKGLTEPLRLHAARLREGAPPA